MDNYESGEGHSHLFAIMRYEILSVNVSECLPTNNKVGEMRHFDLNITKSGREQGES